MPFQPHLAIDTPYCLFSPPFISSLTWWRRHSTALFRHLSDTTPLHCHRLPLAIFFPFSLSFSLISRLFILFLRHITSLIYFDCIFFISPPIFQLIFAISLYFHWYFGFSPCRLFESSLAPPELLLPFSEAFHYYATPPMTFWQISFNAFLLIFSFIFIIFFHYCLFISFTFHYATVLISFH